MKKTLAMFLVTVTMFSLVACGENNNSTNKPDETVSTTTTETVNETTTETASSLTTSDRDYDENDPIAVLGEITNDFAAVTSQLTEKLTETFVAVGTTYEDYQKNKGLIDEWIELVYTESDALFVRTKENSIAYFKLIAADDDHKYSEFCEEALDEYYDTVYDEAMDEYYDTLYDDAMDNLYDEYYDGIIEDAYDDIEYKEWSDASSECYEQWSDTSSEIYKKWSDESSYIYGLWSAMSSAFCWNDNFDVDAIVTEYEAEKAKEDTEKTEETAVSEKDTKAVEEETEITEENTKVDEGEAETKEQTQNDNSEDLVDGLRPEFKEAMDSYEAFYTEYCNFMKEYSENPTDVTLLAKYTDMLTEAQKMNEAFEAWDEDELNNEELKYYLDVNNRVMKMLVDVAE